MTLDLEDLAKLPALVKALEARGPIGGLTFEAMS